MARIAEMNAAGRERLALVDTFGCQQNEADSERIRGMLREMGYGFTEREAEADVIVLNTCAVREHAEKRVLGNVGALTHTKRAKPDQIIVLCGCMVQQPVMAEKIRRSYRIVDLVFGPQALWRFPELLERVLTERTRVFAVEEEDGSIAEGLPAVRQKGVKAWLSAMYGCNNYCSYCIVPYVRGRERSRRPEVIVEEARALVASGYRDITLLGQNVNSYGKDLSEDVDFPRLLRMVNGIPGEFVLRFMTSHPKDAGEELFRAMAECEKVENHLHLPFQSGSDAILKKMNRRYTKADYLALVELARRYIPDLVVTSDIIVGFPGETEADFLETMDVIERVRFDALFTFIYSKRPGTPAAEMDDPDSREVKQARFDRLIARQNAISGEIHAGYVGKRVRALVDGVSDRESGLLTARTSGGRLIHLKGGEQRIGEFAPVEITGCNTWALYGEICE
ncbi:MAG: tRNA (N6-isopentenyl adenosine(37)-C2)-methylthiotransferase MiaB [Oscillospiraceae bacterium]|nr:tRNA (N6-isopentenyl adenosine(37)-C2)-methylthiotransferase MiaB [Oscillospiraceae bacterium]